ncbi:MAG TPA: hypothetical protein VJ852_11125 [Gemmatimonadaceae bacterium]|nr:hypothetical protein [Gemmatimonadaceae bacterium]
MRYRLHLTLILLAMASIPSRAAAQLDTSSYDANALRLESHFGDIRIIRGISGPVVASVGTFHKVELAKIVGTSENAAREAREFERNQRPGAIAALIGGIIVGTSIALSSRNDPTWGLVSAELVGVSLVFYGGVRLNRAYNALSRSLWWYNRDLKR